MTPDRNPGSNETHYGPAQIDTIFDAEVVQPEIVSLPITFSVGIREEASPDHVLSEDVSLVDAERGIFGVFDGMGGYVNGDAAARAAADSFHESLSATPKNVNDEQTIGRDLLNALSNARIAVGRYGMGGNTVGTATKFYTMNGKNVLGVAHAGDTRLFKYNKKSGEHEPLTTDQSEGNAVDNGLYPHDGYSAQDECLIFNVESGDRFMLCSDGITGDWKHEFLTKAEFKEAFSKDTPDQAAQAFLSASKKKDDKTVIVFDLEDEAQSSIEIAPQTPRLSRKKKRQVRGYERQMRADRLADDSQLQTHAGEIDDTTQALGENEVLDTAGGIPQEPSGAAPRSMDSDRYQTAREQYESADRELARSVAKRTKLGMFTLKSTREALDRETDAFADIYESQAEIFEKIQIDQWKTGRPDMTDEELVEKLAEYHTAKQHLHDLHIQEEFRQIRGRFGKLSEWNDRASEWYAGLSRKQKVAAAVGGIALGAALGAAVTVTGAVLGTGAAVVGGAGLAGAKIYKASMQARSGLYTGLEQAERMESRDADGNLKSQRQLREEASTRMEKRRKEKAEHADKVNRRARIATIIAGTALIGGGIISHTDLGRDIGEWFGERFAPVPDQTPTPSPSPTGEGEAPIGDADGSTTRPPVERPPEVPPVPTPETTTVSPPEYSVDATTIESGEGWYQTFSEMGITNPTEQANLLQKVGPELQARGWAYPTADGSYGIIRPGALPKDVLDLIKNSR